MIGNDPYEEEVLFVLTGMERSGTIWATRLLADALQVASHTLYRDPPYTFEDDPAVWHPERPGRFIRRLHYAVHDYPYESVPCVLLVRDPRDVAVSRVETSGFDEPQATYDAEALRFVPVWVSFYTAWEEDHRCIDLLRYEDLLSNPQKIISDTLSVLGLPFEVDDLEAALREHSFPVMVNRLKGRNGRAGVWRERLSQGVADYVWAEYKDALRLFGYGEAGVLTC